MERVNAYFFKQKVIISMMIINRFFQVNIIKRCKINMWQHKWSSGIAINGYKYNFSFKFKLSDNIPFFIIIKQMLLYHIPTYFNVLEIQKYLN